METFQGEYHLPIWYITLKGNTKYSFRKVTFLLLILLVSFFNASYAQCDSDVDNDGVCDDVDLDSDNDGILNVDECMMSDFQWSNAPTVNGKTATGLINGVPYTYTSSINIETTPGVFSHSRFPSGFNVPNIKVIKNRFASTNTITFNQPVLNPILVFSSIGGGSTSVPIQFSNAVEVIFQSGPVTIDSPTRLTGTEGYVIVRMNGVFNQVAFDYLANENYVNFTFGADFATFCDSDNDGTPDYLDADSDNDGCLDAVEGDAGFKLTDVNGNDILAGAIDANGVPVAAAGGQGKGSSADPATESLVCAACDVEKPAINGVDGQAFHSFYFDADKPLNETVNGLAAGEKYKIKVTGTWSVWSSDPTKNVLDAAYRYKQKNASADITPVNGIFWQLNGSSPSRPVPDVYNVDHTYFFEPIATGNGEVFFFADNNYGDNGGGMNFEFFRILDTIKVCASNSNTLLSDFAVGQNLKWYSTETSNDGTATVPNINNNIPGLSEYWVTQTEGGCESERIQMLYLVKSLPVVDLGADIDLCEGESVTLNAGNHTSYLWSSAATTKEIEVTTTGNYSVEVTSSSGCKATSTVNVNIASCFIDHIPNDTLYVCEGDSIVINANDVTTQVWGGDEGFTQINGSSIKVSPSADAYYFVGDAGGRTVGQNLIVNGDFENGNTGFSTEYVEQCTKTQGPGKYCINNNPKNVHNGFSACGDHTTGTGNMYIANGAPVAGQKVWCQTVNTEVNKEYEFSAWVASVVSSNPPKFQFQVNGVSIGELTANVGSCQWDQYAATWNSGAIVTTEICLLNQNTVGAGNDFAIDDISFAPVQQIAAGGDSVLVVLHDQPQVDLGNDTSVCIGEAVTFKTQLIGDYLWSTGATKSSITVNQGGDYTLEVTSKDGCKDDASVNLIVKDLPIVNVGNDTTICIGDEIVIDAQNAIFNFLWNTNATTQTITINAAGTYGVEVRDEIGCLGSDSMELFIQALPVVNVGSDTIICDGEEVTLNAKNNGLTYLWNTSETGQEITLNQTGTYGVEVTDAIGCLGSDSMELVVNPMPFVNLGNDTAICIGETVTLNAQNSGFNYKWSTGESSQVITINSSNDYEVVVFDAIGCADTSEMKLIVNEFPVVNLGNDTVICEYHSIVLDAQNEGLNFIWNEGSLTQTIEVFQEGLFSVEVRDSIGCLGVDEIYVTQEFIEDPYLEKEHLICEGTSIVLEPDFPGNYSINWAQDPNSSSLEVTKTGAYDSYVASEYCLDTFTVNVTKIDTPDAVITDLRGEGKYCFDVETTTLRIISDGANDGFDWADFGRDYEVEIDASGSYQVTVSNEHCTSSYSHNVEEYCAGKFFVPNAFTPGDDNGLNEYFRPISNGHVEGYDFRIYNRWGVLIFQTNSQEEGWNGDINSNIVQTDVYMYRIGYTYASESGGLEYKEQVGTVTLVR